MKKTGRSSFRILFEKRPSPYAGDRQSDTTEAAGHTRSHGNNLGVGLSLSFKNANFARNSYSYFIPAAGFAFLRNEYEYRYEIFSVNMADFQNCPWYKCQISAFETHTRLPAPTSVSANRHQVACIVR